MIRELPQRATRGKRMTELLGEEKDLDEAFWNQDYFKEKDTDTEYEAESEQGDIFDEDFFKSESEEEVEKETEEKSEKKIKKKKEIKQKKKEKHHVVSKMKMFTQRQMLEEAAITEMYNSHSLRQLLNIEEDKKQSAIVKKNTFQPTWRLVDSNKSGKRNLTLWTAENLEIPGANDMNIEKEEKGKYKDPLTGTHYNTAEEFLKVRENYFLDQEKTIIKQIRELQAQQKKIL
ncbi:unnamed protein product [Blepharisma stoltei]|uniref:Vps72/YL1 N-terminal domain-containing protein n=1 Tax=Blepharisma stoltei TaxID=1481888 RepID=A0AAU9JT86_9CILI|nr:unnamed protein product [Blepharisma stoltei]